jgi:hypothetical protein
MIPLRRLVPILLLACFAGTARADQQDLAAAARGVVRVAIVATNGDQAYFVGHGTGFAVAPDKVLTNAHVVELTREEKNLVIGVVPSEGKKSFGGKVIAFSPGNDLALIQIEDGTLPVSTFYAGAPTDGQHVTAIGYPGVVDRAQGLGLQQMTEPMIAVKTSGNISSGRSSQSYDTILHTAPLATGNSGGPLVDDCGRVLGVNSFGSVSDGGNDAEFGFAVSNREIASFLRQAGVQFQRTTIACKSIAELADEEARRTALESAQKDATERARDAARQSALAKARDAAEQQVISSRENAMAIAAVLLALAVLGLGASGLTYTQNKSRQSMWFGIGGGVLLLGAFLAFFLRPSFSSIEDQLVLPSNDPNTVTSGGYMPVGDNICRLDETRSRITVSDVADAPLNWSAGGCVNGRTQFIRSDTPEGERWTRILVPADEAVIAVNSFDPGTGTLRSERYLADSDTLERARDIATKYKIEQCAPNTQALDKIGKMQDELRAVLPGAPNERLIYSCAKGKAAPAPTP